MPKKLLEYNQVNIYQHPPVINVDDKRQVTIGDLHSNPLKFLYILIQQGVVAFKENPEENYEKIAQTYLAHGELLNKLQLYFENNKVIFDLDIDLTVVDTLQQQLADFVQLLETLQIRDNPPMIRLMGDELADRGNNDYFILKILELLALKNVPFRILHSNHGDIFIQYYEFDFDLGEGGIQQQYISVGALDFCINKLGIVSRDEVENIINNYYKPALIAMDYSIGEEGISLYTHAPNAYFVFENAAKCLGLEYNDLTVEAIAKSIEDINAVFKKEYVLKNRVSDLTQNPKDVPEIDLSDLELKHKKRLDMAFVILIWNRWSDTQQSENLRPAFINGHRLFYVHGHDIFIYKDEDREQMSHIIGTDTLCGKFSLKQELEYLPNYPELRHLVVLTSDDKDLTLWLMLQANKPADDFSAVTEATSSPCEELTDLESHPEDHTDVEESDWDSSDSESDVDVPDLGSASDPVDDLTDSRYMASLRLFRASIIQCSERMQPDPLMKKP